MKQQEQQDMILESRSRMRPNRSDTHVSMEEEMEMEGKTRDYFDALAPKRPSKPQRSDVVFHSSSSSADSDHHTTTSPEFVKFQQLQQQNDDHPPHQEEEEQEEYTETEYYKDLNCIDKQHHTTGTGFISVVAEEGEEKKSSSGYDCCHPQQHSSSCKGNPATNDWIPSDQVISDDDVILAASHHKPSRSEN